MASGCGVDRCDVVAVARCATCRRWFCPTHRGIPVDTLFFDLCSGCRPRNGAAEFADHPLAAQEYLAKAARADLLAAGVPLVELHRLTRRLKPRLLRGGKFVFEVVPAGRGWVLGDMLWTYLLRKREGGGEVTRPVLSCFAESEDPHDQYRGLMRVRNDLDHGGYLVIRGWATVQDWAAAAALVRNLVSKTDGPDTAATESTPRSPRQSL
jgi:hypothetical protein